MERTFGVVLATALLALGWTLSGCRSGQDQGATSPQTSAPSSPSGGTNGAATPSPGGAALGKEQAAGPFQITLSTEPAAPRTGDAKFRAKVTRGGKPVKDATVTVKLDMPAMKMTGPEVTLKAAGDGYAGTGTLGMGGDYEAKVNVAAAGDKGTAVYHFMASQ